MTDVAPGFIVHPTSRVRRRRAVVQLFGRLASGEAFLVEDERFEPYFFVNERGAALLEDEREIRIEPSAHRDLAGRPVRRVVVSLPGVVPRLRRKLEASGGAALEADIRFPYRYLIDQGLRTAITIEGESERLPTGLLRYRNPELQPSTHRPELVLLSLDIETTPDASRLFCVALVGPKVDEVHIVSERPVPSAQHYPDERALLIGVAARVRELDPDVLTGWNVIDFDLRVLARRAEELGLAFELGRAHGEIEFQSDARFERRPRADVPGRQVLDGLALVRDAFIPLEDYRLETAAQTLLGRGKLISEEGRDRAQEISRLYREDPAALVAYNREDARLVLEILQRERLVELAVERSMLSGMQLDRVGASIASFDLLYLPELRRTGRVAPSVQADREKPAVQGGAVLESHPGLFANVAVYDFKSLYPSLIRTFNLDPVAHAEAGSDAIVAPNGAAFSRERALLPEILEGFFARRAEAKSRGDRHADLAIKIMMNALFGVLGAASCRFFDPDIANAITGFGQQTLRWTRDAFQAEGYRVLYGDTDSVFVALDPDASLTEVRKTARDLRERVEREIADRVRREYRVEPRLELELERIYERFLQPRVRGGRQGSKKRYAGLVSGQIEIVGLEAIRRDWPAVAGRLQHAMLARVFTDQPVIPIVRETVSRVTAGELDSELVIRKRLRKGSVDRYTATTPPHIQAARKAGSAVERVVRYVITHTGPEPVLPGRPSPSEIDYAYYVEKVLRPVADAILCHLGQSFDEALGRPRQLSLL
jgi:DNA polymerase-2